MSQSGNFLIIPAIDLIGGRCVRLQQGDYDRETVYDVTPSDTARRWQSGGAEWIHVVDLDGAKAGEPKNLETVAKISGAVQCPCELGGGIRTAEHAEAALAMGVERVILGTALIESPELTDLLLAELGPERVVAGLDSRDGMIAVRGWLDATNVTAAEIAADLVKSGVTRFITTDIRRDGMFTGPNVEPLRALCSAVPEAKVIASGGVGGVDDIHVLRALDLPNLEGVIVGKALYDGRVTLEELIAAAGAHDTA